jgi:hypothetical protein
MDESLHTAWSGQAAHHERQEELWLEYAERQREAARARVAVASRFCDLKDAGFEETFSRMDQEHAKTCRAMVDFHRGLKNLYRGVVESHCPPADLDAGGHAST